MNFRWMRGLSRFHLILGYHGGHRPNGKRAQKAVREHSTPSSQTRIHVLETGKLLLLVIRGAA
jgi:hypothetical protein